MISSNQVAQSGSHFTASEAVRDIVIAKLVS
jgi:hypothetical protein